MTLQSYNKTGEKTNLLTTALDYHGAGLKVIPVNSDKRPTCKWKQYQTSQTEEQVRQLFSHPVWGIALLTGQGIEALDFDQKYWLGEKELFQEYLRHPAVRSFPVPSLYIQTTKNDGWHVVYKCAEIGGNTKLAERPATAAEAEAGDKTKVLIETRATGGYIVVAPSPGYEAQAVSLEDIPEITTAERAALFAAAKDFDEVAEPEPAHTPPQQSGLTPWDDYNQQHSAFELLTSAGWTEVGKQGERIFLKRPGDTKAPYSGNYHTGKELFICWSSSTQFEPEKAYSAFGVYAVLNHTTAGKTDFSAAAKALYAEGYGERKQQKQPRRDNRGRYRGYDQEEEPVSYLDSLKSVEQKLKHTAANPIQFAPEIISLGETPIFQKFTVNIIQGREGSHKSRFAELLVSLLIKRSDVHHSHFLGFARNPMERSTVVLIDTERNLMDELPFAIQNIKRKAGYKKEEHPPSFLYTSLKKVPRRDRLPALKEYLTDARKSTSEHLFVVLDVVTDCVSSFNNDTEAMELFDFVGLLCEEQDCTFLLVIHENPGGGEAKARGHVGTESANKASTVLQIGFVKGGEGDPTDLIKLKFRKLRRGKRPEPLNLTFSQEQKGLIIAPDELVRSAEQDKKLKAHIDDVREELHWMMTDHEEEPINRKEVVEALKAEFDVTSNTILARLKDIEKEGLEWLEISRGARNAVQYKMKPEQP